MSTPITVDLIIAAPWIIPVVPRDRILRNCAIAVDDGKIVAIFPQNDIGKKYIPKRNMRLEKHVLLPGFINAHGHTPMTLFRGMADDQPLKTWLEEHIWPAEQQWVSEDFVREGSELALSEMIRSGTTCFSDMYFFPEHTAAAAFECGIRAQIMFPVMDFPTAWATSADEYIHKGLALHDDYRSHELITIGFGPHAPYTVADEPLSRIATYAEELQLPIQIHAHETAHEVEESIKNYGVRPLERLNQLGLLSPLAQCVHMTQISPSDIDILQTTGAHVVHCPASNMKLASGMCPVDTLLENGVNVALGTDGAASNNSLDMTHEMGLAALLGKIAANKANAVSAMTAIEMATINGARAMGLDDKIGSIEVGKDADVIGIDLSDLNQQPVFDPASQIVYTPVGHKVTYVWVKGQALLERSMLTTLSQRDIKQKTQAWQKKLSEPH